MAVYDAPPKIVYEVGGGINRGDPPTEIARNESVVVENFYALGKKLVRRGGVRRVTTSSPQAIVRAIIPYKANVSYWGMILIGDSWTGAVGGSYTRTFARVTYPPHVSVLIPLGANTTIGAPWWVGAFVYNGIVYFSDTGCGLLRVTTDVQRAGIAAPTSAPAIAEGVAGALAAGDYQSVYTYYDSTSGAESNPSPASNVLALTSLHKIDYTGIADPPSGGGAIANHITGKRVYRTLVDQVGEYYYVGSVALGATTLTEEVLPESMGDPVLFDNNLPPTNLRWAANWNERCFGTDGINVYFTNLFNVEGWTNDVYPVYADDGHLIVVLYSWGDRLVIGKTNRVHYMTGTDRSTFRLWTLSDKAGCSAPNSMRSIDNSLFWYGNRNFYRCDGSNTYPIGDVKIRPFLDAIPPSFEFAIAAEIFPALSQYVVSIPDATTSSTDGTTGYPSPNKLVLVYNYRTDVWTVYRHPTTAPMFLTRFATPYTTGPFTVYPEGLYGVFADGYVYHFYDPTQGQDYDSNPITAKVLTREEDGGSLFSKALRRVHLLCTTAVETITLKAYRDGRSVPSASRSVSLSVDSAWKAANLSTLRDPGSTVQLGIEYTGTTAIEIESLGLELEEAERFSGQPQ